MTGSYLCADDPTFGIAGDDSTDDTAALQTFLEQAVAEQRVAYLPGRYKVSETLQCGGGADGQVRILGNVGFSRITSSHPTADILRIGDGANTTGEQVNGWLDGIVLNGPHTKPYGIPQNGQAALLLDKMSLFQVRNVVTRYTDIGIDLHNNCYGSSLWNCKTGFGNAHNVGLNLPSSPDTGTGNQIFSYNCWHEGTVAAVHISPNGDGYAFYGGQFSATRDSATRHDGYGAVIFGKDYRTGATGSLGAVSLYDIDFEQVGSWFLRGYGEASLSVQNCLFLANGSQPAIGVLKHDTGIGQSQMLFLNCTVSGQFSGAAPMVMDSSDGSLHLLHESGWRIAGSNPVFAGRARSDFPGLLAASGLSDRGFAVLRRGYKTELAVGAGRLRFNGAVLEKSTDGGTTWITVG